MKVLIRDYLASLRERGELDAILPDLLSELGYTVYSSPQLGTVQHGVDIAAVGIDDDGERKVFLFSVKAGDLTRDAWNGTLQALRPSLDDIRDAYIPNRIPTRYRELNIVICPAFGGDVQDQVRDALNGYFTQNTTDRITFDEWNGDRIAGLILKGILREEILPRPMRSSFQNAIAMVDEPDVAYQHFAQLARDLRAAGTASAKARVRTARQLNICLWILFVWARDVGNVEAPYRASELTLLSVWELLQPTIGSKTREAKSLNLVLRQVIELHVTVASDFLDRAVRPCAEVRHGLSMSIRSQSVLDVNLALFEILGRISVAGLWIHWLGQRVGPKAKKTTGQSVVQLTQMALALIRNNPALFLPITDRQGTEIALFLQLWLASELDSADVASWLQEMANRLDFTMRTGGRYPSCASDYRDLAEHPRNQSDDYFKEVTVGSTVIPLIAAWLQAFGNKEAVKTLNLLVEQILPHCNLQLWMPDATFDYKLCDSGKGHGRSLSNLQLGEDGSKLLEIIEKACNTDTSFESLSPIKAGFWPVIFVACRHHQLPIPPGFWIKSLKN